MRRCQRSGTAPCAIYSRACASAMPAASQLASPYCVDVRCRGSPTTEEAPMFRSSALALLLSFGISPAFAQGIVSMQKISAALANELVGESVAECNRKGYKVVAVVVDLDGVRQA